MLGPKTKGERIIVEGQVIDGAGARFATPSLRFGRPTPLLLLNHPADRQNKPIDEDFRGWGRAGCDFESGRYRFRTIKPGAVVGRSGYRPMAPHVNLWIVARGINIGLSTRMYFSDEEVANATDPVLNIIEPPSRRKTLIGQRQMRDQDVLSLLRYSSARRAGDRLFPMSEGHFGVARHERYHLHTQRTELELARQA